MNRLKDNINLDDEKRRSLYFHEMAGDSRTLELLLNTCYRIGIIPYGAGTGHGKGSLAHIILKIDKEHFNSIGMLMDIVEEIENAEFNIKSDEHGIYAEMSCDSVDSEELFTLIKDTLEGSVLEKKHLYSYTIMSTVYNIAKIVREVLDADVTFAINDRLYDIGRCGLSIYKRNQKNKVDTRKADDIYDVIDKLKTKSALHLPTVFFCRFDELRTFYFELDETVYSKGSDEEDGE